MSDPAAASALPSGPDRRVLLVDDDRDFADGLANLLRLERYHVTVAYTAAQALAAATAELPHVALVDLRLGQTSGVDLVRRLRALHQKVLPVVLTAYASMETSIQAMQAGSYDYLCKPFHINDLLATLERCFERHRLAEERELALTALARSEEQLRRIIEHSPSAIALEDLSGTQLLVNECFRQLFVTVSNAAAAIEASDEALVRGGHAISREIELFRGGETRYVLLARFPVLDVSGIPIGIGTIGTDTTERHRAEDRLRQAQRLEAIGRLTGGVAHDFNNLLAVVLGNLRLIEEEVQGRSDLREMVSDALAATASGVELTERLLAVGQSQSLQPEITEIRDLLATITRLLRRVVGETIQIVQDIAPDLWRVRIDRSQLESSLLNLAINSRDAMPSGGRLTLAARNVMLKRGDINVHLDLPAGRYVALSVRDTGTGMSTEIRDKAVQPFFTTKRISQDGGSHGSGLGLSMALGFVRQSGGQLHIASVVGEGTDVTIYLPMVEGPVVHSGHQREGSPVQSGRGEHVLVVEDQPKIRQLLRRQLERLGYVVQDAADASGALRLMEEARPIHVLLTDVVLPGEMSGLKLCRMAMERNPKLGVVLMTGYATQILNERSGRLADAPVLRKPIEPALLADTLRRILDQLAASM